jgi:glycine/D-amino acid oxidase-like deaminating enzyme
MGRALTSLWADTAPAATERPPLPRDLRCDVAVVGGGFTGLWTAYYLLGADPSLRVVVLEAEEVGYGASGRNGGWCSALFPTPLPGMHDALVATIDEIARVLKDEEVDAHFHRGGTISPARTPAQLARMQPEPGGSVLSESETRARLNAVGTLGGTFTPHCARVHPLRLVRGLAAAVERRGGVIYEQTRALALGPGSVRTRRGVVSADVVVRATEGYTARIDGLRRAVVPVYSLIVATEPLPASTWDEIGLGDYETFNDHRHLIVYGQRTDDDRLVFGGRGAPYHWGSRIRPSYDVDERVFAKLRSTLVEMLPAVGRAGFTHAWGGALGIPRDWCASVGLRDGMAWAGGYVGDGVSTTNLAGRTLTDLVLGRATELTALPWVDHDSGRWEPEPLRWLGVNAGLRAMTLADVEEQLTQRPSRLARAMSRLVGDGDHSR